MSQAVDVSLPAIMWDAGDDDPAELDKCPYDRDSIKLWDDPAKLTREIVDKEQPPLEVRRGDLLLTVHWRGGRYVLHRRGARTLLGTLLRPFLCGLCAAFPSPRLLNSPSADHARRGAVQGRQLPTFSGEWSLLYRPLWGRRSGRHAAGAVLPTIWITSNAWALARAACSGGAAGRGDRELDHSPPSAQHQIRRWVFGRTIDPPRARANSGERRTTEGRLH